MEAEEKLAALAAACRAAGTSLLPESLGERWQRLLCLDAVAGANAHRVAMAHLRASGALFGLISELREGEGVAQRADYHTHDVLTHNVEAFGYAPPRPALRMAALLHDVGKPRALRETGRMLGHDRIGGELAEEICARLGMEGAYVARLIRYHMWDLDGRAKAATRRRRIVAWGPAFVRDLACLREADVWGSGVSLGPVREADAWRATLAELEARGVPFAPGELALDAEDLARELGLSPAEAQRLQGHLLERVQRCPSLNGRGQLLRLAKRMEGWK